MTTPAQQGVLSLLNVTSGSLVWDFQGQVVQATVVISGNGTTSGGGPIVVEEMYASDYAGTWSVIQSITAASLSGDKALAVHIAACLKVLRIRIASPVTGGGDISAFLYGTK